MDLSKSEDHFKCPLKLVLDGFHLICEDSIAKHTQTMYFPLTYIVLG